MRCTPIIHLPPPGIAALPLISIPSLRSRILNDFNMIQNIVAVAQPKYIVPRYCSRRGLIMLRGLCDSPNRVMAMTLVAFHLQAGPNGPWILGVESIEQLAQHPDHEDKRPDRYALC